ncbi:MAG TPA: hypothetical protein VNS58_17605 [Puia sp.]|nr:hypothetical protein [Puia sp.]
MSIVICKLPKAGLGNQLFPLVKAATFAKLNDLSLIVTGYNQLKIGPYIRGEKVKRKYKGYFSFERSLFGRLLDNYSLWQYRNYESVHEPAIEKLPAEMTKGKRFLFSEIPHWSDYFTGLKEHRDLAISLLKGMISDDIMRRTDRIPAPCVGVHIRMGDFRKLREGEAFTSAGAVRTPEYYFVDIIGAIRKINGGELPVSVFTDGYGKEFEKIFTLKNVSIVEGNPDIVDLLLLSKSRIIVASAGSTFSYWAGFLSDSPLIMHPDHLHAPVRPAEINRRLYEGAFTPGSPETLLEKNIKQIGNE